MKTKRVFVLLICVALCYFLCFLSGVTVFAEDIVSGTCGENVFWTYDAQTQTVTITGTGAMSDFDGSDPRWERYYSQIRRVVIGEGITHICANAFLDDVKIVDIAFLGDMPTFGDSCFAHISASAWYPKDNSTWTLPVPGNHGATDLFFQKGGTEATHCGENATWQYDAATATLTIGGSGPMYEFYDEERQPWASFREEVKYVVVGEGITHIGRNAFSYMYGLENIRFAGDMPSFSYNTTVNVSVQGSYPDGNKTWDLTKPQKGSTNGCITWSVHQGYSGSCGGNTTWHYDPETTTLTISGSGRMNAYEQWENPWRFYNDEITKVVVKGTVDHIGDYAFFRLFQVTEIIIEEGVTSVGRNALQNTKVTFIDLPDSIESMGMVAIGCSQNLTSLTLPPNLQSINTGIVLDCPALKNLYVGGKVTEVAEKGFSGLENANVFFAGNAPKFHENSFWNFSGRIFYPEDDPTWTKEIRQMYGASGLIWIPYDPENPDSIVIPNENQPEIGQGWTYHGESGELIIYDGCDMERIYALVTNEVTDTLRSVIIEGGLTEIPEGMFAGMPMLESVQIGESVTVIGMNAFADCTALKYVSLPEGLTGIEMGAFINASSLEKIAFPSSLEFIGDGAFELCCSLRDIAFTGSVPRIGEYAFNNVEASVNWPVDDKTWEDVAGEQFGGSLTWLGLQEPGTQPSEQEPSIQSTTGESTPTGEENTTVILTDTVITPEILESAARQNITLVLDGVNYQWTIQGSQIQDSGLHRIDLGVTLDTQNIPESVIASVAEGVPARQLSLAHEGEFGFVAELELQVGEIHAGKEGTLYYYNGQQLEYVSRAPINSYGEITLLFTHASDYVIVIDDATWAPDGCGFWITAAAVCGIAVCIAVLMIRKRPRNVEE